MDYSDHKNPLITSAYTDGGIDFDRFGSIKATRILQKNEVRDFYSDFFDYSVRTNYASVDSETNYKAVKPTGIPLTCTKKQIADYIARKDFTCQPFFSIKIIAGNKVKVFERKYKTVLAFLSDLGGIFDILLLIGGIFYCSYNSCMMNRFLK